MAQPPFVDRVTELATLERAWQSGRAELVVLYGRRRIGKTALLREFMKDKPGTLWVATMGAEPVLRRSFTDALWRALRPGAEADGTEDAADAAAGFVYETWERAFQAVAEATRERRLALVIDELPYAVGASADLPSVLQKVWDERLETGQLMLILCGSHIGMMERDVLAYGAPLYGRRTAQLRLGPLPLTALRPLFPAYTAAQLVETYAILGGIPAYLLRFDSRLSVMENVARHVLDPSAFLYAEPLFLLREELREPRNYFAVLQAVAQGRTTPNEISKATGMDPGPLARYLATLRELGLLERRVPVTETQPEKSRRGLYMVQDRFLRFWFRFVAPNASALEMGRAAQVAQKVARELPQFVGPVFEDLCRAWTAEQAAHARWPLALERFGSFWSPHAEVDVVGLGGEGLLVGECKWSREPVGMNVLADLRRRAEAVCARVGRRETQMVLFSRSGFTDALEAAAAAEGVTLVGLEEVLGSRISPGGDDSVTSASAP